MWKWPSFAVLFRKLIFECRQSLHCIRRLNRKFNEAGLVILFLQRDNNLEANAPLDIRICQEAQQ